jgi:hypothetical protein
MKLGSALLATASTSIMAAAGNSLPEDAVPQVKFALITVAIAAIPSFAFWVSKQTKTTDWVYKVSLRTHRFLAVLSL